MFTLFNYQGSSLNGVSAAIKAGHRRIVFEMPTGGGKTVVLAKFCRICVENNKRVCIVVPNREIYNQFYRALKTEGLPFGQIKSGLTPAHGEMIQIASAMTLVNRLEGYDFDVVVTDEAHHILANTWQKIINWYPRAILLGCSATPQHGSGKGIGDVFTYLLKTISYYELFDQGRLIKPEIFCPEEELNLAAVAISKGDFAPGQLAELMDKPSITGHAAEHLREHCPNARSITFCVTIQHAMHTMDEYKRHGLKTKCIDGNMRTSDRDRAIRELGDGTIDALTSCMIVSEGTDIPAVDAGVMLRPTFSLNLYRQQSGRIMRVCPGKTRAFLIDPVGNTVRHGLPYSDIAWDLHARPKKIEREGESSGVRICTGCKKGYSTKEPKCPYCGLVPEVQQREVDQKDGKLVKIEESGFEKARRKTREEQGRARNLDSLIQVGIQRGYKDPDAWANHIVISREQKNLENRLIFEKNREGLIQLAMAKNIKNVESWADKRLTA